MSQSPNEALMDHFDTRHVFEKKADGSSYLARLVYGAGLAEHARQAHELAEAKKERALAVAEELRALQAARMGSVVQAAHHTRVPLILRPEMVPGGVSDGGIPGSSIPLGFDEGMIRMAAAIGADLAHMDKAAAMTMPLPNMMGGAGGAAKGVLASAADFLKKNLTSAGRTQAKLTAAVAPAAAPKGPGVLSGVLGGNTKAMQQAYKGPAPAPVAMPAPTKTTVPALASATGTAPTQQGQGLFSAPAKSQFNPVLGPERANQKVAPTPPVTPPAHPAAPAATPAAAPPPPPAAQASSAAPAAAPPAAEQAAGPAKKPGALDRLGAMSGKEWGSNLKRMAVMGGLAYGGYKLLNKGMDVMGAETAGPTQYGAGGPELAYGVNQYGQPQY
jgi:hypothetical protein